MSKNARRGMLLALCLVVVVGLVLTGCGKKEAALKEPGLAFTSYIKGTTVDFDEATYNNMAGGGGEAGFKYGIMQAMYPTIFNANKDTVAQALFPAPYWRGDGVHTYYSFLTSADQTAVQGTIFATKLSAAEQALVTSTVDSFFALYDEERAAAKALNQNTAYGILASKVSADAAAAWQTDAAAWMTALDNYAKANYSNKTYAQLTLVQRKTVEGIVFANGAGTINPEYALWRAMVKNSFRNANASSRWPDKRDGIVATQYAGKTYATLDCIQRPTVDATVWATCNATEQAAVTTQVDGMFTLSEEQVNGVTSDNMNVYVYALSQIPGAYLTSGNSTIAIGAWLTAVNGTVPGSSENTSFYAQIAGGQTTYRTMLAGQYFGAASFDNLTDASKAVVIGADLGMFGLSVAQRAPAMDLDQNVIYTQVLAALGAAAQAGWKADVTAGMDRELAMYKWMAYEGLRNGTAAQFYPTQVAASLAAGKTYAALTPCEQIGVNAAVWALLGAGEQGYVSASTMPGLWNKVQAEMTDAVAIDQTSAAAQLRASTETSAAGFKKDVEGTPVVPVRTAFYRWLAKEKVKEMGSAAVLIRESVGEFYVKITNPNEYAICIDQLNMNFQTTAGSPAATVDGARQMLEDIWVPAREGDKDGEVTVKVLAPTKTYDLISWLVMAGKDSNTARSMAMEVFDKIQAGTIVWTFSADLQVSANDEVLSPTYSGAMTAA